MFYEFFCWEFCAQDNVLMKALYVQFLKEKLGKRDVRKARNKINFDYELL